MAALLRSRIRFVLVITFALSSLIGCRPAPPTPVMPGFDATPTLESTPTLVYSSLPTLTPTPGTPIADQQNTALDEVAQRETLDASTVTRSGESPAIATTTGNTSYVVQPGDTLLALASQHELPMAAVQKANGMGSSTTLYAGQTLIVPAPDAWKGASTFWAVYDVQKGDTLTGIAQKFGLDFVAIVAVNELTDADVLQIGQPLVLPLEVPIDVAARAAVASVPSQPPSGAPAPTEGSAAASTATPQPVAAEPPMATVPAGISAPPEIASWPGEVFARINAERAAAGLGPFTWNDTLAQAAYLHGLDCQQRGFCNHTGSDGSTVKTRVLRAGYPALGAAECIVYSRDPQQAVFWWMDEVPPDDWHRRTILSTWVTEIGIAVVPNHLGTYYFIADFGRPQ